MSPRDSTLRLHEAANTRDLAIVTETIDSLVAPDAIIHTPLPFEASGAALMKELFVRLLRAYPDLHIEVEDLIAEGDRVVSRNTVTGTHLGEYLGLAPTGRSVAYDEVVIMRFADGRMAESWAVVDMLAQLRQLGAIGDADAH
jgi:predicted ester cyclase